MSFIWEFGGFTVFYFKFILLFLFTDLQGIFYTLISDILCLNVTDFRPTMNFKKKSVSCDVKKALKLSVNTFFCVCVSGGGLIHDLSV